MVTPEENAIKIQKLINSDEINGLEHKAILKSQEELKKILQPISDTYKTVGVMSKWIVALLVFISLVGGVIWTWGNVIKNWINK